MGLPMQHVDRPVVSPIFVGRDPHVQVLERYLDQAAEGRGLTLLIAGEAGVGKTRFVAEARTRAARRGMAVLEGYCFESYRSVPYAPLVDLVRAALAGATADASPSERLVEAIGPDAPALVTILPELASLGRDPVPAARLEHGELEKGGLFRALANVLSRLAATRPALVIVEDAHWSDDASLDFLLVLARQLAPLPVLLLITYRDDEVSPALSRLLAGLDRQRIATELRLARLSRAEVDEMLQAVLGLQRPVRSDFLEVIASLTDGNPFFIEEVLRSLIAEGEIVFSETDGIWDRRPIGQIPIPRSIRDSVAQRSEQLDEFGRRTLALAAVAGQRFDFELLEAALGQDERTLVQVIKHLIAASLVVEESADRFAFRHALTREAVYAGLLARERKMLHREIAESMERLYARSPNALESRLPDLAEHCSEAELWDKALRYAPRAGERAQALYAPRAAVEQFTRALEAARHLGVAPPIAVVRARGRAFETLGEFDAARTDFEAVLDRARAADDRHAEWQALLDLGAAWMGRSYQRGGEYYRQALDIARTLGEQDPRPLAHSLNRVGNWHSNAEQPRDAIRSHEEALALFRALDDRHGIAETLDHLALASYIGGDAIRGSAYFQEAVERFRELDNRPGLASALATLAMRGGGQSMDLLTLPVQEPRDAQRDAEAALEIAREIGWRSGESYAMSMVALSSIARGDYARADRAARAALLIAEEIEHQEWTVLAHCANAMLLDDLLALPEARRHYERALALAREAGSLFWTRFIAAHLARTCVAQGDAAQADSLLDDMIQGTSPAGTWAERALWWARAQLALARGDPEQGLRIADELIAADSNAVDRVPARRLALLRGEALAALGRTAEAEAALVTARRLAAEQGARPLIWRVDVGLGRLYAEQARRLDAEAAFAAARSLVDELVAEIPDAALQEAFLARATEALPRPRPLSPRRAAKLAYGGLTEREREVAVLVGRGKSNREIAEALVLGERTVQTHVRHILEKLGFSTRAQIAAWAVAHGLLAPTDQ